MHRTQCKENNSWLVIHIYKIINSAEWITLLNTIGQDNHWKYYERTIILKLTVSCDVFCLFCYLWHILFSSSWTKLKKYLSKSKV